MVLERALDAWVGDLDCTKNMSIHMNALFLDCRKGRTSGMTDKCGALLKWIFNIVVYAFSSSITSSFEDSSNNAVLNFMWV